VDVLHLIACAAGAAIVVWSNASAIRSFMIPGAQHHLMGRLVFRVSQSVFLAIGRRLSPRRRNDFYTLYGPIGLLGVYALISFLNGVGCALIFWAIGGNDFSAAGVSKALVDSGSALSTLGFSDIEDVPRGFLSVIEAMATTTVSALLIGYLPVIFSTFLAAEHAASDLEAETGGARCGAEVLAAIERSRAGEETWRAWSKWFGRIGKHHGSLVGNLIMRAPEAHTSWLTAAGAVLDAAALRQTVMAGGGAPDAAWCLSSGVAAARRSTHFLGFDNDAAPSGDPGVSRADFDAACRHIADAGIPLVADLDGAWTQFAALRASYVRQLATLAAVKGTAVASLDCSQADRPEPVSLPVRRGRPLAGLGASEA